ncbi:hypothetical protein MTO96_040033 [Rhipicephalus appendiculatus]
MQDFKSFLQAGSKIYLYYRSYSRQMNGGSPTGGLQRKYRFEYFDAMAACAVITFSDGKCTTKCELHIWAGNVASGPSENCKREYDYSCPGRKIYQVYDNTCF